MAVGPIWVEPNRFPGFIGRHFRFVLEQHRQAQGHVGVGQFRLQFQGFLNFLSAFLQLALAEPASGEGEMHLGAPGISRHRLAGAALQFRERFTFGLKRVELAEKLQRGG